MRYCFKITFDFPLHCIVEPLQQTNQNGMRTYIHVTMMCISLVQKTYAELCLPVHFSILFSAESCIFRAQHGAYENMRRTNSYNKGNVQIWNDSSAQLNFFFRHTRKSDISSYKMLLQSCRSLKIKYMSFSGDRVRWPVLKLLKLFYMYNRMWP